MQMVIVCHSCGRKIAIRDNFVDSLGVINIRVDPCQNPLCYDCSDCEEKEKVKTLQSQLEHIRTKIQEVVDWNKS